jgi:hypothetical protein
LQLKNLFYNPIGTSNFVEKSYVPFPLIYKLGACAYQFISKNTSLRRNFFYQFHLNTISEFNNGIVNVIEMVIKTHFINRFRRFVLSRKLGFENRPRRPKKKRPRLKFFRRKFFQQNLNSSDHFSSEQSKFKTTLSESNHENDYIFGDNSSGISFRNNSFSDNLFNEHLFDGNSLDDNSLNDNFFDESSFSENSIGNNSFGNSSVRRKRSTRTILAVSTVGLWPKWCRLVTECSSFKSVSFKQVSKISH